MRNDMFTKMKNKRGEILEKTECQVVNRIGIPNYYWRRQHQAGVEIQLSVLCGDRRQKM